MKLIHAYVRTERMSSLARALQDCEVVSGFSVLDARGVGESDASQSRLQLWEDWVLYVPQVKVEVVVKAEHIETVCELIVGALRQASVSGGFIYVTDVSSVIRVGTLRRDLEAL